MPRPTAPRQAALSAVLAASLLAQSGHAWRRWGQLHADPYVSMYVGKFCFDYVPMEWVENLSKPIGRKGNHSAGPTRCVSEKQPSRVDDDGGMVDCEEAAMKRFHIFYSYNTAQKLCITSSTCQPFFLDSATTGPHDWVTMKRVARPGVQPVQLPPDSTAKLPAPSAAAGLVEVRVRGTLDYGSVVPESERELCENGRCESEGKVYLLAFSDEEHRWEKAMLLWDDMSCEERLRHASHKLELARYDEEEVFNRTRTFYVRQSTRPRFWYFFLVNCGAPLGSLDFSIHALNIRRGFQAEFSVDLLGSLPLEVLGWAAFAALAMAAGFAGRYRRMGSRASPLLVVLFASSVFSALGCGFRAVHHLRFAVDGRGIALARILGTLIACAAKSLLSILQFFLAKGWGLFFTPDEMQHRVAILVGLASTVALSVGCEVHEHFYHALSTNYYQYESWPGLLILTCNLCLLAVSWILTLDTYLQERSKAVRAFYLFVSASGGIYFASLPVIHVVASVLSPWVVRKYVERAELGARFMATFLLLHMLWPSRVDMLVAARLKNRQQPHLLAEAREVSMTELAAGSAPREDEEDFQEPAEQPDELA